MFSFSPLKQKIDDTIVWLQNELAGVRTGQASPALLDGVRVEVYGSAMPLNQVASVTIEDPKTLRVSAWDAGNIKALERAIADADLGVSSATDEKGVRVHFPPLTSERRTQLVKIVSGKLEEARITLRHERDRVWNEIQKLAKEGEMSEDEKFRAKEEMEKRIKEGNDALAGGSERKRKRTPSVAERSIMYVVSSIMYTVSSTKN
jgi:ribosome recycling factor